MLVFSEKKLLTLFIYFLNLLYVTYKTAPGFLIVDYVYYIIDRWLFSHPVILDRPWKDPSWIGLIRQKPCHKAISHRPHNLRIVTFNLNEIVNNRGLKRCQIVRFVSLSSLEKRKTKKKVVFRKKFKFVKKSLHLMVEKDDDNRFCGNNGT